MHDPFGQMAGSNFIRLDSIALSSSIIAVAGSCADDWTVGGGVGPTVGLAVGLAVGETVG